jgi:hypothetical protein
MVLSTSKLDNRSRVFVHVSLVQRVCRSNEDPFIELVQYYAQTNGQAESSNKTLIKLIKKKIGESPRRWRETLSEALWVHITSKHGARKVTPFELTYS